MQILHALSEDNSQDRGLSFCHVGGGIKAKFLGLVASLLTSCAILMEHIPPSYITQDEIMTLQFLFKFPGSLTTESALTQSCLSSDRLASVTLSVIIFRNPPFIFFFTLSSLYKECILFSQSTSHSFPPPSPSVLLTCPLNLIPSGLSAETLSLYLRDSRSCHMHLL